MKNPLLTFTLLIFYYCSNSQDIIRQQPCNDQEIEFQADSIKTVFGKNGFHLVKEASMMMESEYEMPVIVPLNQGSLYRFVFIGDKTSRLFEVTMYDWEENRVAYEKNLARDENANVISYVYLANSSGFHLVKPVQINKKKRKELCGYIMFFEKIK